MTMQEVRRTLSDFVLTMDDDTTARFFKEAVCSIGSGEIKLTGKELVNAKGDPTDLANEIFMALKQTRNAMYLAGRLYEEVFTMDADEDDIDETFAKDLLLHYRDGWRYVGMLLDYLADIQEGLENLDSFLR